MPRRQSVFLAAALMLQFATSAGGQTPTLPVWTRVRVAMRHDTVVEGRVVRGDSRTLTIATGSGAPRVLQRDSIFVLSATSNFTQSQAVSLGMITGAMGAILGGASVAHCRDRTDCYASATSFWVGGGLGFAIGLLGAGAIASPSPQWHGLPASVDVRGRSFGLGAVESCILSPSIHIEMGLSSTGSPTQRLAVPFGCYHGVTVGGEIGQPSRITAEGSSYTYTQAISTTTAWKDKHFVSFGGGFVELPFRVALNPRLIISGGDYRRDEETYTRVVTYNNSGGQGTPVITQSSNVANHPGFGAGVGFSVPCWRQISLGLEVRTHWLLDHGGGPITTVGAAARLWP